MPGRCALALCMIFSLSSFAETRPCTPGDVQRADRAVDALNSWDRIHDWYKNFRQCDDGGPAEGVSEAVARNLVDRWDTLPRLGELANDEGFRLFVLKHVDETLNEEDLKTIGLNAERRCPTNLRAFCRELKKRTEAR